jgi:redox-sensing transcriptional repressor
MKDIPAGVIERMTKYLALLDESGARGVEWISSQEIADALGLTSSTVRQDLSHVDFSGISKRGYAVGGLKSALERQLGADEAWRLVMVGAGNLGSALAQHQEFARRGFLLCGLFDSDPAKLGKRFGALPVRSMGELRDFVVAEQVDIGVIAVPAGAAQQVADLLIASGIRGLLNLTLTHISAPRKVAVVDARIVASLQELAHAIKALRA